jgi:hypothetical protein
MWCEELNLTATSTLSAREREGGAAFLTHGLHNSSYTNHRFIQAHNSIVKQYRKMARFHIMWQIRFNLSVLPLITALLPRGDGHIESDCTHKAFDVSPWRAVRPVILRKMTGSPGLEICKYTHRQ